MILNKQGFILYDGLIGILILSTTIFFSNGVLMLGNKIYQDSIIKNEILTAIHFGIDQGYLIGNVNGVNLIREGVDYCGIKENSKVCI